MPEHTLVDLERQISAASQLRIALSRGEFARLKQDVRAFLDGNAMFRDSLPTRWWREDHTPSDELDAALTECMAKIAISPEKAGEADRTIAALLSLIHDYIGRARRILEAQKSGTKTEIKEGALDYLQNHFLPDVRALYADVVSGLRSLVGRRDHVASTALKQALLRAHGIVLRGDPRSVLTEREALAKVASLSVLEQHIVAIDPFSGKSHFKEEVIFLFEQHLPLAGMPGSMGQTRWLRKSHAPTRDLLTALEQTKTALELIATTEKRAELQRQMGRMKLLLGERKVMQIRIAMCEKRATEMHRGLGSAGAHVSTLLMGLRTKRAAISAQLLTNEEKLNTHGEALLRVQAEQNRVRDELALLLEEFEQLSGEGVKPAVLEAKAAAIVAKEREERSLVVSCDTQLEKIAELKLAIAPLLVTLDQLAQVELHALDKQVSLTEAIERAEVAWEKYKEVKALVFYFGVRDNILDNLLLLGVLLTGGRTDVDAMGNINLVLAFDAGVRVGVELGIFNLNAKVKLTLTLSGTLAVLDGRQVMFSHRVAVYATASTDASVGGGQKIAELLHAPVKLPDELVRASARAKCALYDVEACDIYEDQEHWAFTWAHQIARRLAFLRVYKETDRACQGEGDDWVTETLQSLREKGVTPADADVGRPLSDRQTTNWKAMLGGEEGKLAAQLKRKVHRVSFDVPLGVEASASVKVVGLDERSLGKADAGKATFVMTLDQDVPLGKLLEDSAVYSYGSSTENEVGATIFHRIEGPHGVSRSYLELTDKKASSAGADVFSFQSARTSSKVVGDRAQRFAMASALHLAEAPGTFPRRAALPPTLSRGTLPTRDDHEALARTLRMRLDMLAGKKEVIGRGNKLLSAVSRAPETLGKASDKLASAASAMTHGPILDVARGAGGEGLAPKLREASDLLAAAADSLDFLPELPVALVVCTSAQLRCTDQPRFTVEGGKLVWHCVWTPQVYRGTNLKTFQLRLERDVEVAPLLSVFFGFELVFRKEHVEFEVLGLATLSYLKTLHASFRVQAARWDQYWDLHGDEMLQICKNVADPASGAFAEVLFDALGDVSVKGPARTFGEACWRLFKPAEPSPFASLGSPLATVAALASTAKRHHKMREALADRTPKQLAKYKSALLGDDGLAQVGEAYMADAKRVRDITRDFGARVASGAAAPSPDLTVSSAALTSLVEAREKFRSDWAARLGASFLALSDKPLELIAVAKELAAAFAKSALLDEKQANWLHAHAFGATSLKAMPLSAARSDDHPLPALTRDLFEDVIARLAQANGVPDASRWNTQSRENISYFQKRSTATKALDHALDAYHVTFSAWQSGFGSLRRKQQQLHSAGAHDLLACEALLVELRQAIAERLTSCNELLEAVAAWQRGRDPESSDRTPNVCVYLEQPLLLERIRLRLLDRLIEVHAFLADSLVKESRLKLMEETPSAALLASKARDLVTVRRALQGYLDAASAPLQYDALVHGIKKLQLPGQAATVERLKEGKPAPPASSGTFPVKAALPGSTKSDLATVRRNILR